MPRFDLSQYETVEERIKKFYAEHPDGRILTKLIYEYGGDGPRTWVFKASVYLTAGDQAAKLPKATGYASEVDGTGGANNGSAAENAETSSIGRALANMNLSGNKRSSREEMSKVNRIAETDWEAQAAKITDVGGLRWLYSQAKVSGAPAEVLERLAERAKQLSPAGEGQGADGGLPASQPKGAKK
jgi:hypothetical protein